MREYICIGLLAHVDAGKTTLSEALLHRTGAIRNAGRVVSKTMIMEHVWEYNFDPRTNIVETRICHLREKIDKPFDVKLLHTVRGFGYVLEARPELH